MIDCFEVFWDVFDVVTGFGNHAIGPAKFGVKLVAMAEPLRNSSRKMPRYFVLVEGAILVPAIFGPRRSFPEDL